MPIASVSGEISLQAAFTELWDIVENSVPSIGANKLVFTSALGKVVISGSFNTSTFTGPVTKVVVFAEADPSATAAMTITDVGVDLKDLLEAYLGEGTNSSSLEDLLLQKNWTFNGSAGADILLEGAMSGDEVALNFKGNDTFNLAGGNDDVFAGDGNDTMNGGNGRDTLNGGNGNDRLFGNEKADLLNGGAGSDRMDGGAGVDTFAFKLALGAPARDVILNFEVGLDVLDFGGFDVSVKFHREGDLRGALVLYEGGEVFLQGVTRAQINDIDFA